MAKGTTKKIAIGAVVAAVAGYIAGILTAPKSGKETREDIKDKAVKTAAEAEKQLKRLQAEISSLIDDAKREVAKLSGKAKDELNAAIDAAKAAKDKAQEVLSALHKGGAEDQDLQKAVTDAQQAFDHLKSYLKKSA